MRSMIKNQDECILSWWLKVDAANPLCIYYFGPFTSEADAESSRSGHLTDLSQENTKILHAGTQFCQPRQLTILEDELTVNDLEDSSANFLEI